MYYKHLTIVKDDSSVISKGSFTLIDDPRVVIYDCHRFIIQATPLVGEAGLENNLSIAPMDSINSEFDKQLCYHIF